MDERHEPGSGIETLAPASFERIAEPAEPGPRATDEPRWQVGIVPPRGALPQRFGAPASVVALLRLALLLVLSIPLLALIGGFDIEKLTGFSWRDLAAPFGALLLVLAQRLAGAMRGSRSRQPRGAARRKRVRPMAIVLEPAGVTVVRLAGRQQLSWSALVGLGRREGGGWDLLVQEADSRLVVELPSGGWGRRLGRLLSAS